MKIIPRSRRILYWAAPLVLIIGLLYHARTDLWPYARQILAAQWRVFEPAPLPVDVITYLFDMGIADVDNDGHLDVYTTNHNYRQFLFRNLGRGTYKDVVTDWHLDQNPAIPGLEQSMTPPVIDRPGLYVYWVGDTIHLDFHDIDRLGPVKGSVRFFNLTEIVKKDGVQVVEQVSKTSAMPQTRLEFSAATSGRLVVYPLSRGAPMKFSIDAPWARSSTFVGSNAVVPRSTGNRTGAGTTGTGDECPTCLAFEVDLLDRHSMAWSDFNHDGIPDVFINRGALGGTLRLFPPEVRDKVGDEFMVSESRGLFANQARELGIQKNDCSGRHVRWVDFDSDGLLDLFINCMERGNVAGAYRKQFYRQGTDKKFVDVASQVKLDLPDAQIIDIVWFDADGDGVIDAFTNEDTGFYLYRFVDGAYVRSLIHRGPFLRSSVPGLKGNTYDYWQFDGKISVADFNADGYLDVFVASKKGNVLLVNRNGKLVSVDPASLGLPTHSAAATWVDYDNDGRMDLHVVPDGLVRQRSDGRFEQTGLLALAQGRYQAAIINWFDRDNDGTQDVIIALQENATLWRWWDKLIKSSDVKGDRDARFDWKTLSYHRQQNSNHWLELKLAGLAGNPEAIGAYVTLTTKSGRRQARQVGVHDGSYFSQGHYRLYFGLGDETASVSLDIRWPNGNRQSLRDVSTDRLLTVAQAK